MTDFQLSLNLLLFKCTLLKPPRFPGYQGVSCRSNYYLCLVASYTSPSDSSLVFSSPTILPRVMLRRAVAVKKKVLEMLSPKRCIPGLQRIKISAGTSEHRPGFQSTTWWGTSYSDWMTGSSWWKKNVPLSSTGQKQRFFRHLQGGKG